MNKKWILLIMFLLILILFLLNVSGIYPKETELLPGDMEYREDYVGGEIA